MKRQIYILLSSLLLTTACSVALEYVAVPNMGQDWKIGYQQRERFTNSNITEFIPKNDTIDNWSKLVTIQYVADVKYDLELFVNSQMNNIKQKCKDISWSIIEKSKVSIQYEWYTKECSSKDQQIKDQNIYTAQHVIGRYFIGNDGLHMVSYAEKTKNINKNTRDQWVVKISKAHLLKNGELVNVL